VDLFHRDGEWRQSPSRYTSHLVARAGANQGRSCQVREVNKPGVVLAEFTKEPSATLIALDPDLFFARFVGSRLLISFAI
jgi:hypothetical protein